MADVETGQQRRAIAVLPDHVIDQIAAGEVIERPSSVVKELVDNALDAGARSITVEIEGGGRGLIRVVDDGIGMAAADARLALTRHATSKLRDVSDLMSLRTMGFRGEALPSIASISKMTLTTRRADDDAAFRIELVGGTVTSDGIAGAAVGTSIEVRDLLFNVPARLKFLKGDTTESTHVTETVARIAMAYPDRHFRLRHNGRITIDVPVVADGLTRARALLPDRLAASLHEVHGEEGGVRVVAYLAAPELAQASARGVQLFVGNRPVRDRGIMHAIAMGYGELIPRGRYPVAVVMIDAPDGAVDFNVHPQKLEVRFSDSSAVHSAVRHVVRRGVAASPWSAMPVGTAVQLAAIASVAPPTLRAAVPDGERTSSLATGYAALASRARLGGTKAQGQLAWQPRANDSVRAELRQAASPSWTERMRAELFAKESTRGERASDAPAVAPNIEPIADAAPSPVATESGYFSSLRFLGQLDRTYLVCEGAGELVLVDQHSAHERAEFHKLREAHRRRGADGAGGATTVAVQRLLFATSMDATATQLAVAQSAATVLADVGFEVEPFSGGKLAVKTVPAGLRHSDPQVVLRQLLDDLAEVGTAAAVDAYVDRAFSTIACHSALRAGDRLDAPAAEALLRTLDDAFRGTDESTAQPHGRPVLLRLGVADLARRFGR